MVLLYQRGRLFVKEALEDRRDLGAGGVSLWLELVVRHTADQAFPSPKGLASRRPLQD